jgi:hypothetical protein
VIVRGGEAELFELRVVPVHREDPVAARTGVTGEGDLAVAPGKAASAGLGPTGASSPAATAEGAPATPWGSVTWLPPP